MADEVKEFDTASADRTDDHVVVVLFNGPDNEIVGMFRGAPDAAHVLWRALGSALTAVTW